MDTRAQTSPYFFFGSLLCLIDKNYSGTPSIFYFSVLFSCSSLFAFIYYHCCWGPIVCIDSVHMMRSAFELFASFWMCLKCLTTHDNSILVWNVWTSYRRPLVSLCVRYSMLMAGFAHKNWYIFRTESLQVSVLARICTTMRLSAWMRLCGMSVRAYLEV